jgi:hypothetical protein
VAGGVIYLDIDDEITSAAARIRTVEGRRAAVVLPHGSRVATSRINFRLLARDALTHEKRLSIIAPDAATRALAASAGLPVFGSVGEYEDSLGPGADAEATGAATAAAAAAAAETPRAAEAAQAAAAAAAAALAGDTARTSITPPPASDVPVQQTLDDMEAAELAAAAAALRTTSAPTPRARAGAAGTSVRAGAAGTSIRAGAGDTPRGDPRVQDEPVRGGPVTRGSMRTLSRTPLAIALAAIALALLIGGVGAYLVLPSATITVTPKNETVGPVGMTIRADPNATAPDADAKVVPAEVVTVDATATNTFPTTGKRVEEAKAKGVVRFRNKDFTSSNTIPAGSIVSTQNGIRFKTDGAVTVPRADLVGFTVFPKTANVKVTAIKPGTDGNVEPNTIVVIPKGEDPISLDVVNPDETTGGKHDEFPKVSQKDVDAALAALEPALQAAFAARLEDPSIASPGATVFPETGVLGVPVPTVDPASLVDQEVPSFELGLNATGTVTAVNPGPVETVAAERLRSTIDSGHRLVENSIKVAVDPAVVSGDQISFPATATATQVAILDPDALKAMVIGRPLDEARSILGAFGQVRLEAWPDWVSTVPTLDGRVTLTLDEALPVETPEPTASP